MLIIKWNDKCKYDSASKSDTQVTGYVRLPSKDNSVIINTLATIGPVSVALRAAGYEFMFYSSGLYVSKPCLKNAKSKGCQSNFNSLNHAVVLIGYNMTDVNNSYFTFRNSWGTSWGLYKILLIF